jgi:DNA end-binding protein Ku
MARTVWKGSLSFGLVSVPVGLYPATQDKTIHFNQLESGTSDRIRYKKVNERTGDEVAPDRIVKGFDLGGSEYVILSDEELASAEPERTRQIGITDFVELDEIDPTFYRTTYYLAPEGEAAAKPYALLRQAMREANKVAIGTLVMRNKEYLVAIRPDEDVLALETMYFADEVRSPIKDLPDLPTADVVSEREMSMAQLLIDSMEGTWNPKAYHDTHREKIEALIEKKRQGKEIVIGSPDTGPAEVIDLMEALNASVEAARSHSAGAGSADSATTGAAPAKKVAQHQRTSHSQRMPKKPASSTRPKAGDGASTKRAPAAPKRVTRKPATGRKAS